MSVDKENARRIKSRYVENHPDRRKESWSKYNKSEDGRRKKHEWYRRWAKDLGIRSWEDWVQLRKSRSSSDSIYPASFSTELKQRIRERDGFQCQSCLISEALSRVMWKKPLTVHHINYDKITARKGT